MSEQQTPQQPLYAVSEKKEIPAGATAEIFRLHEAINTAFTALQTARETFSEYVKAVRKSVGIPAENTPDNVWEITEDAKTFVKLSNTTPPIVLNMEEAAQTMPPTSEPQRDKQPLIEGDDAGDVCCKSYEK